VAVAIAAQIKIFLNNGLIYIIMETAAFFDLDDTIIKGNSGLRYMKDLYQKRILKPHASTIIPSIKLALSYFKGDYKKAVDQADNLMALAFKGSSKKKAAEYADFFAKKDSKNFKEKIIKRIEWHKKEGHKLILLSASPNEVVEKFGKILGFDYATGSRFKDKGGIYTGELVTPSMIGKERAIVAKKIAKELKIDLKKSYAYGNCVNDLEVLEITGNPLAVNPNRHLAPLARKKGFRII